MRIGHISDIHWLDTSGTHFSDFLNKRISGCINLWAGRSKIHSKDVAECAIRTIKKQGCDHLIVTGDLTNLALSSEFHTVKHMLNRFFADSEMTVVPGNHDFYTAESAVSRRFEQFIYPVMPGNLSLDFSETWPFVRVMSDIAVIGLNSAQPRPWFVAAGRLGKDQLDRLVTTLEHPEVANRFKIVALHHHLFQVLRSPGEMFRHLDDRRDFLNICLEHQVGLIVHGHNHDYTLRRVNDLVISEAGSCSVCKFKKDNRAGKFNIYTIEEGKLRQIETWRYVDGDYVLWQTVDPESIEVANLKKL